MAKDKRLLQKYLLIPHINMPHRVFAALLPLFVGIPTKMLLFKQWTTDGRGRQHAAK